MKKSTLQQWHEGQLGGLGNFQSRLFDLFIIADGGNKITIINSRPKWFNENDDLMAW